MILIGPPYSGKSFGADQNWWIDGDQLVTWPGGRFWEDQMFDLSRFYLQHVLPVIRGASLSSNVAINLPASVITQLRPDEYIALLPDWPTIVRNMRSGRPFGGPHLSSQKVKRECHAIGLAVHLKTTIVKTPQEAHDYLRGLEIS